MQTLKLMNMTVIEDYKKYEYNQWNCVLEYINTSIINFFSLHLKAPFCTSTFASKSLTTFLNVHLSYMYIMYTNASNSTLSYTHVNSYIVWRVQPVGKIIN